MQKLSERATLRRVEERLLRVAIVEGRLALRGELRRLPVSRMLGKTSVEIADCGPGAVAGQPRTVQSAM